MNFKNTIIVLTLFSACFFIHKYYQKDFVNVGQNSLYHNFYTPDIMTELDIVVVQGEEI